MRAYKREDKVGWRGVESKLGKKRTPFLTPMPQMYIAPRLNCAEVEASGRRIGGARGLGRGAQD